jgi:PAS domain S-box-containing protein
MDAQYSSSPSRLLIGLDMAEQLNDLLWMHANLAEALRGALEFLCSAMGFKGGEIFVQNRHEDRCYLHLALDSPHSWSQPSLREQLNALVRQILDEERIITGRMDLEIGVALPLMSPMGVQGALVLAGKPSTEIGDGVLPWLGRNLGRRIAVERTWTGLSGGRRGLQKALTAINAAHSAFHDLETVETLLAQAVSELLGAQQVILYVFEDTSSDLVLRKTMGRLGEWRSVTSLRLERGLAAESARLKIPFFVPRVSEDTRYDPQCDGGLNGGDMAMIVFPAIADQRVQGLIAVTHSPGRMISDEEKRWLSVLAGAWAYAIHNTRLINSLRVINANLEVSRWQLINSRNTLRALFDSLPNSIYIVDRQYTLMAVNKSRVSRLGVHPSQVVGKACFVALFGRSQPCAGCKVMDTFLSAQSQIRSLSEQTDNGSLREWEITTYPIQGEDGQTLQVIVYENDVTERRRMESRVIQSEKLAAVGQLAAGVAHEINNPLAAILANAQLLRRDLHSEDEGIEESLRLIEIASTRAVRVVQNLLSFARKDNGELAWISINQSLEKALALLNHEIVSRGVQVETNLAEDLPEFFGSPENLESVWVNLLLNAMDAMPQGEGRLMIRSWLGDETLYVGIRDNGHGISPEHLPHIFEPFFTTKGPGKGTGLGLSLCYQIVRQHGGNIQVESQPGEGTEFIVSLPLKLAG